MSDDPFRASLVTLRFTDPAVEAAYAEMHARKSLRHIRLLIVAGLAINVLHHLLTLGLGPSGIITQRGRSTWVRPVGLALVSAIIYAWSYRPEFVRRQQAILSAMFCLYSFTLIRLASLISAELLATRAHLLPLKAATPSAWSTVFCAIDMCELTRSRCVQRSSLRLC